MNEMELLRELAGETPLPAPAELDRARARLVAAITTAPATYATAVAGVTTSQPDPSGGQAVDLLRPAAPAPVLSRDQAYVRGRRRHRRGVPDRRAALHRRHPHRAIARAPPHRDPAQPSRW